MTSRQRAWQKDRVAKGLCRLCGKPGAPSRHPARRETGRSQYCVRHRISTLERTRQKNRSGRRNLGAAVYELPEAPPIAVDLAP